MPLVYSYTIKSFTAALLVCGVLYLLDYRQLASHMLLGTGCMGMAITVGSAAGWVDVMKDGRVIPPASMAPSAAVQRPLMDTKT